MSNNQQNAHRRQNLYSQAVNEIKSKAVRLLLSVKLLFSITEKKKTLMAHHYHRLWIQIRENQSEVNSKCDHALEIHPTSSFTYSHINRIKCLPFTVCGQMVPLLRFHSKKLYPGNPLFERVPSIIFQHVVYCTADLPHTESCSTGSTWFLWWLWQFDSTFSAIGVYRG